MRLRGNFKAIGQAALDSEGDSISANLACIVSLLQVLC